MATALPPASSPFGQQAVQVGRLGRGPRLGEGTDGGGPSNQPPRTPPADRAQVVVLPLVPVTPATVRSREGCPKKASASGPRARRDRGHHDLGHVQVERALASGRPPPRPRPRPRAKSWPSRLCPGTQANRLPGTTRRESIVSASTSVAGSPVTRLEQGPVPAGSPPLPTPRDARRPQPVPGLDRDRAAADVVGGAIVVGGVVVATGADGAGAEP